MKKKLLFSAYSLEIGGIETSLIALLKCIDYTKYDVTLVLEKKEGMFLNQIPDNVQVFEYISNKNENPLIRKFLNLFKRIQFALKYKNKYDFAGSFATYSRPGSFVARTASKNNCLWIHTDYMTLYNNDIFLVEQFLNNIQYKQFKNVIFVSNKSKEAINNLFVENKQKVYMIKNIIDYKEILTKSNEEIELKKEDCVTFLNVSRHDEHSKKLTRIIEVARRLKDEEHKFKILFIGDGKDTDIYKELIEKEKLEDIIILLGAKDNPYPYFKISDCILLSSDYEGYPVVFAEAFVMNLPIITTEVSDSKEDVANKFGIVTEKNVEDIYINMKKFIEEGFEIKESFDAEQYNKKTMEQLEKMWNM